MTTDAQTILHNALCLADTDRAALAAKLIESLDASPDPDAVAAWEGEIARRIDELDSKRSRTIPWEQARQAIRGASDGSDPA
jgi:putative addiction module component (TIGR02574 family)